LREGTAIADFFNPPKTVIGVYDKKMGQKLISLLYHDIPGKKIITDVKTAETIKYIDNTFHALKVTFANEVGIFCKSLGIDSHKVMEIFCHDKKLNLSPLYLKPGKPFGGSCLPKDLKVLVYRAKKNDLELPVIYNILPSNDFHLKNVLKLITSLGKKKVGIIGLSFKENTDDLRHSPLIKITESLIGKGYKVSIFDKNVSLAKIFGSNKEFLIKHISHISSLITDNLRSLIKSSEIIILANKEKPFKLPAIPKEKIIIDLVRVNKLVNHKNYHGICW
jgi:GDP-mannose 6-dehydrogenase